MDAQAIAETWVLREVLPTHDWVGVYANVLVKNRSPRSRLPAFERQPISIPKEILDAFPGQLRTAIHEIEDSVGTWARLCDQGMVPLEAAKRVFVMTGTFTGACVQYSRCGMYPLCSAPGREDASLAGYRPKTYSDPEPNPKQLPLDLS